MPVPTGSRAAAAAMFGTALPEAERYAELLAGPGVAQGLIGPAEAERVWERHILNCGAIADFVPSRCSLIDVGSGAGLPGIVLAILRPGVQVTLLEPMARRVQFLRRCMSELGLDRVEVVRARAEDVAGELSSDVVTARAVAPLARLTELCAGVARPGGIVLAMKGASAAAELAAARPVLARLGVADARVLHVDAPADGGTATVVAFTAPARRPHIGKSRRPGASRPGARRQGSGPMAGGGSMPGGGAGARRDTKQRGHRRSGG